MCRSAGASSRSEEMLSFYKKFEIRILNNWSFLMNRNASTRMLRQSEVWQVYFCLLKPFFYSENLQNQSKQNNTFRFSGFNIQ